MLMFVPCLCTDGGGRQQEAEAALRVLLNVAVLVFFTVAECLLNSAQATVTLLLLLLLFLT